MNTSQIQDRYPQLAAFVRTALPPLLARYGLVLLRVAAASPFGRALGLFAGLVFGLVVIIPALMLSLIVGLLTQDLQAAATAGLIILVIGGVGAAGITFWLWSLYRKWRRRKLGF